MRAVHAARLVVLVTALGSATLLTGCWSQKSDGGNQEIKSGGEPQGGSAGDMDAAAAIAIVKTMIQQNGLSATTSLPYTIYQTDQVPCSPQEADRDHDANPNNPELWQCKSASGDPPFVKQVQVPVQECCRTTTVSVHFADFINWNASPAEDDKWNVHGDYTLAGQSHEASWLVDKQTKEVGAPSEK
jgi:hypothetical protein